jgi:uncharacterized membrane protein YjgN (DUF898 family)
MFGKLKIYLLTLFAMLIPDRLLHNKKGITGMVISLIVTLAACGILIPIGVYLNAKLYSALPAMTGTANTTATAVRDNIYSAYSISAVIPLVAAAAVIIGIIVAAFAYTRRPQ